MLLLSLCAFSIRTSFHDGAYSGGRNSSSRAPFRLPMAESHPPWSTVSLPYTAFSLKCWLDIKEVENHLDIRCNTSFKEKVNESKWGVL